MGKQKYTIEIIELVIKMRHEGKTIPEIQSVTGMGKPSQQKLYRQRGIYLTEEQKDAAVSGARWKNHEPIVNGMKVCSVCKTNKRIDEFHHAKSRRTGLTSQCKQCFREYYAANAEKKIEQVKTYRLNNDDKIKAREKVYYNEFKEEFVSYAKSWSAANPEKVKSAHIAYDKRTQKSKNARTAEYRARKINATPKWLTKEQKEQIKQMYLNCPRGYHVDHIVPLRGEEVCGMHVPWNLQYLPGIENMSKGNKLK